MVTQALKQKIRHVSAKARGEERISVYRISKDTGVNINVLTRFLAGTTNLSSDNIDRLCSYFGLELKQKVSTS